jgi:hypothetical protein
MSATLLAAAAIALGQAIQSHLGFYTPEGLVWLTVALGCTTFAVAGPRRPAELRALMTVVLYAGIVWQLWQLAGAEPAQALETRRLQSFHRWARIELLVVLAGMMPLRPVRLAWFPVLAAIHVGMGLWILHWSPSPPIDVITVHNAALRAIVHGHNPYAITFANIYGAGSAYYAAGAESGGRVLFGYPYPPLSLLMVLPGYLLGDYRYAQLVAIVVTAALIAFARPSQRARLAGALFLTTPRAFFVLEQGWSEPSSLLLLALTIFVMLRAGNGPRWADAGAVLAGLTLASKQYFAVMLPMLWRSGAALGVSRTRLLRLAIGAAAVVILPFFLWGPRAFLEDVVLLQLREPFRTDALSYLVWVVRSGWPAPSMAWTVAALAVALAIALARGERSPSGLAAGLAFTLLATFAFGKKAFCNYYFLVIGMLCCAVAARQPPDVSDGR